MKSALPKCFCLFMALSMLLQISAAASSGAPMTTEPSAPTETTRPAEDTQPTDATEPTDNTQPTDATEPTDNTQPTDATEPTDNTQPTDTTDPTDTTEPTEPDPLEGYVFPDNWAKEALMFAVRNGILTGHKDKELAPYGKTSRAEMATMLVRLTNAHGSADVSAYEDLSPDDWYYEIMRTAVEAGIFNGKSDTIMAPLRHITRQEAFTVLARAFGLCPGNPDAYKTFKDSNKIKPFAMDAVSALTEIGCLEGYGDNTLRPDNTIKRQEVASMFYKLLDAICDTPSQIPQEGFVIYRGTQPLEGIHVDGTLIVASGLEGDILLKDITATDHLIVRPSSGSVVTLENVTTKKLTVASQASVSSSQDFDWIAAAGKNCTVKMDSPKLDVYGSGTFEGSYDYVKNLSQQARFTGKIGAMDMISGGTTTVDGTAGNIVLTSSHLTLNGSGFAEKIVVRGRHCNVTLATKNLVDEVDWGLDGVKAAITGTTSLNGKNTKLSLKATFTGFKAGYGTTNGGRTCQVTWYEDGRQVKKDNNFTLREGATSTYTHDFADGSFPGTSSIYKVVLTCGSESVSAVIAVKMDPYQRDYNNALKTVKPMPIPATVLYGTYLYSAKTGGSRVRWLSKGTEVTHLYHSSVPSDRGKIRLSDGTVGWIDWDQYLVSKLNYTTKDDYSVGTKEGFVDKSGYSSRTGYLIWLSLKTQKVNIFEGRKGNWTLVKSYPCATGANVTPTYTGVHSINYKTARWRFDYEYGGEFIPNHNYVHHVSGFWGGQAFHSRLYLCRNDELYDGTMGTPVSHGCVRMYDDGCTYIYNRIPYNTTVVVY